MPPKVKITKDAILEGGVALIREKGHERLNARELADALGCSVQPIFRNFGSMEGYKERLREKVREIFREFLNQDGDGRDIPFLGEKLACLEFAGAEKNLFRFLTDPSADEVQSIFTRMQEEETEDTVGSIREMTGLGHEAARRMYEDIWIITNGMAALLAADRCDCGEEQTVKILRVLADAFLGIQHELHKKEARGRTDISF